MGEQKFLVDICDAERRVRIFKSPNNDLLGGHRAEDPKREKRKMEPELDSGPGSMGQCG